MFIYIYRERDRDIYMTKLNHVKASVGNACEDIAVYDPFNAFMLPPCFAKDPFTPTKVVADPTDVTEPIPLPACFTPAKVVAPHDQVDCPLVKTTKERKKTLKLLKKPSSAVNGSSVKVCISGPRAEVTRRVAGQRHYLFTLNQSSWGDSFAEDAFSLAKEIEDKNLDKTGAKQLRDAWYKQQ